MSCVERDETYIASVVGNIPSIEFDWAVQARAVAVRQKEASLQLYLFGYVIVPERLGIKNTIVFR